MEAPRWYEYDLSLLFSLLPLILVCIISSLILLRKICHRSKLPLPPGPRGLPIIGHLHLLGKLPHQSLFQLSKTHGPLMSLRLGSVPLVVASDPEMARQILQTHDVTFAHRMRSAAPVHLNGCMDIAFSPPNAYWRFMRRLCATELFSNKGINLNKVVREEEVGALMRSVLAESGEGKLQQMRPKLHEATNHIVVRLMLGKRFSEIGAERQIQLKIGRHEKAASMLELINRIVELLSTANVADFFPYTAWMDPQGVSRSCRKIAASTKALFDEIIEARLLANSDGRPPNDYLDVLLQASQSTNIPIHIMEVIMDMVVAGTGTTAVAIEWAMLELLANPEKMEKLRGEMDEVVGRERMIGEDDIERLPYLVACVKETLRLHPPLPILLPHKTGQACDIMNFHIPKNTQAFVNIWAIGRDPKNWENPTTFSPERFLEAGGNVDVLDQHFKLLPFGSGRRICPAWKLGLLSLQVILGSLIQGFAWTVPPSHHLDLTETFQILLPATTPLVACATPRLPKELYAPKT